MKRRSRNRAYGIIDPEYARAYTIIRRVAWMEGYAIGMHGSFTRDLDLIAVPWADHACEPLHLVKHIAASLEGLVHYESNPSAKPHGRIAWLLHFAAFHDPRVIDLSIMPRLPKVEVVT